jgi:hypothetical protein
MLGYDSDKENDNDLDTNWIDEFDKVDKDYESFYMEDLHYLKVTILYVNKSNEVAGIKEDKIFLKSTNLISRDEIIGILKRNSIQDKKKFTIMTLLKYNIDLEPTEVRQFLLNNYDDTYLSVVKDIDDIKWSRTISMFHDLNNLFVIFYEDEKMKYEKRRQSSNNSKTKRIYMSSSVAASLSGHNKTVKRF